MYSQKDEEAAILKTVGDHIGGFIDVGAFDGYNYSNTMALVDRGWQGIMVEPGLDAFKLLLDRHGDNDKLTLVHAAVGLPGQVMTPFWNNPRTFSTSEENNRFNRFQHEGFSPKYWTPLVDFYSVAGCRPDMPVDVVSIDTEGTSVDLFKSFPFGPWRPLIIMVEHDGRRDECISFADGVNYRLVFSNEENLGFEAA